MLEKESRTRRSISTVLTMITEKNLNNPDLFFANVEEDLFRSLVDYCIKSMPEDKHNIESIISLMDNGQEYVEWVSENPIIMRKEYQECYMLAPEIVRANVFVDLKNLLNEAFSDMERIYKYKKEKLDRYERVKEVLKKEDFHRISAAIHSKHKIWNGLNLFGDAEYNLFLNLICYCIEFMPEEKHNIESIIDLMDNGQNYIEWLFRNPKFTSIEGIESPSYYMSASLETRKQVFSELENFIHSEIK